MYLSESETAGDLFYMELGNLPARTAAKLSFSYVQELDLSRDKIGTFMLPTVINPRYMPEYSKIISILVACHWSKSFQRKSKAQLKFTLGLLCFRSICELLRCVYFSARLTCDVWRWLTFSTDSMEASQTKYKLSFSVKKIFLFNFCCLHTMFLSISVVKVHTFLFIQ